MAINEKPNKRYSVKGCNLRYEGKTYKEGAELFLSDEEAARLTSYLEPVETGLKPVSTEKEVNNANK